MKAIDQDSAKDIIPGIIAVCIFISPIIPAIMFSLYFLSAFPISFLLASAFISCLGEPKDTSKEIVKKRKKRGMIQTDNGKFQIIYKTFFLWIRVRKYFFSQEEAIEWLVDNDSRKEKFMGYLK